MKKDEGRVYVEKERDGMLRQKRVGCVEIRRKGVMGREGGSEGYVEREEGT